MLKKLVKCYNKTMTINKLVILWSFNFNSTPPPICRRGDAAHPRPSPPKHGRLGPAQRSWAAWNRPGRVTSGKWIYKGCNSV